MPGLVLTAHENSRGSQGNEDCYLTEKTGR